MPNILCWSVLLTIVGVRFFLMNYGIRQHRNIVKVTTGTYNQETLSDNLWHNIVVDEVKSKYFWTVDLPSVITEMLYNLFYIVFIVNFSAWMLLVLFMFTILLNIYRRLAHRYWALVNILIDYQIPYEKKNIIMVTLRRKKYINYSKYLMSIIN